MTRICYVDKNFAQSSLAIITVANDIIQEYLDAGYSLTLRQLYYQFVARDLIENSQRSYKRLGSIINDARLAGMISWDAIEDRTRNLQKDSTWDNPSGVIRSAAASYAIDLWKGQDCRLEVWVEKDALIGVMEKACEPLQMPFFSCRGYTSQSEVWGAAQRHLGYQKTGQDAVVLHLGDHDPSGMDMSRDIQDRLHLFGAGTHVRRIALNMDQVDQYSPPPNPAKLTDSRCASYLEEYGDESWELDALSPKVLVALIEDEARAFMDQDLFDEREEKQEKERELLELASDKWYDVVEFLEQQ